MKVGIVYFSRTEVKDWRLSRWDFHYTKLSDPRFLVACWLPVHLLAYFPSTLNHILPSTYRAAWFGVGNAQCGHGPDDGQDGLQHVAIDDGLVLQAFFWRIAVLMNDPAGSTHPPLAGPEQSDLGDWESGRI